MTGTVVTKNSRRPWLVLVAVMAFALTLVPAPANGQINGRLELAGQTPYVNADGEFNIALDWTGPRSADLQLTVTVHGVVSEESELESPPGEILNRTTALSLDQIETNEFGQLVTTVPIRSFTPADDGRLWLENAGVYPVTIEIRSTDGPVATTRTNLIRLPTETAELELLPVGIILSVASADGLTIGEASALLANHPTVPLSVLLGDGVLAQLNDDPVLAETFRTSVNGRPVLAGPELSLDPSALAEIGQGALYQDALIATRNSIVALGLQPTETILPIDLALTIEGAQLLVELGIERAVDISASSQPGGSIAAPAGPLQVVRIDDDLTSEFAARSRAASRAHHLLARLAVRYETDRTPVVLGGPAIAKAEINSLEILFSAVDQLGLLEAVDLNETVGGQLPVRPAESPSQDLQNLETDISQTLATIDTYESFHITGGTSPEELRADLLSALSRDLNPENRARATAAVTASIDSALGVVSLAETESVTVAARSSTIPLTINNSASGPRSVLLRFQTDKVDVVQHGAVIEIPAGTSQLDIEVETRSLGLSPLEMVVLTPDERHELTRTSFQVRSTAVPGLGMLLSGTALVFLLIWWGRSIARSRREADSEDLGASSEADDIGTIDSQPAIGADA